MSESGDTLFTIIDQTIRSEVLNSRFSIEDICKKTGVSRSHLHRKIKEHTGFSTSIYIRKIRLDLAQKLLLSTDKNISEIAYQVGINSPQNFSKYFVTEYGLSPKAYRQSQLRKSSIDDTVTSTSAPEKDRGEEKPKSPTTASRSSKRTMILGYFSILVMFLVFWLWIQNSSVDNSVYKSPLLEGQFDNSIAVLPFARIGNESADFFCDGITEDIISNLALVDNLKVISRTSSLLYRNSEKSIKEIGKELGVAYILEGSVRKYNDQLKITAQLIRSSDDFHVWASDYDRNIEDVFAIQSLVAKDIVNALSVEITSDVGKKIDRQPTDNILAYNDFLIGRYLLRSRSKKSLQQSIARFDAALAMDSSYADAHAFKAAAIQLLGDMHYMDHQESNTNAEASALAALDFDHENSKAYSTLANIYVNRYKWQQAEVYYKIALKHNPNDALINYWYSLMLRYQNRMEEALEYNLKAKLLDPLYPVIHAGYIVTASYAGFLKHAKETLENDFDLFQDEFVYHWADGIYHQCRKKFRRAIQSYEKALEINDEVQSIENGIMYCKGKMGLRTEVESFIKQLGSQPKHLDTKSKMYLSIGQEELALELLAEAANKGFLAHEVNIDPTYHPFQSHEKFKKIVNDFGLQ